MLYLLTRTSRDCFIATRTATAEVAQNAMELFLFDIILVGVKVLSDAKIRLIRSINSSLLLDYSSSGTGLLCI